MEHGYPSIEAAFDVPDEPFSIESKIDYASRPEDSRARRLANGVDC